MNPYLVLGVPLNADDSSIRRAYLEAVSENPPETQPARFKELVAAYEKIKDELSRHRYELFDQDCSSDSPIDACLRHARLTARSVPPSFDTMKELLRACAKT